MAAALNASGPSCCSHLPGMQSGKRLLSYQRLTPPCHGKVRQCGRVTTTVAASGRGDDSSGCNRIGRSMDDNASTDEPWWKLWQGRQKGQGKSDRKPAGNSLNGKYNVASSKAAGKSGSVTMSAAGKSAAGGKAPAQPTRRTSAGSWAAKRAGGTADSKKRTRPSSFRSSRSSCTSSCSPTPTYDSSDDDDTFWFQFNNIFTNWQDGRNDEAKPCDDASEEKNNSCDDGSTKQEGGSWFGGLFEGSATADDAKADKIDTSASANDTSSWSFGGHSSSHDTGSSYSSQDSSSYSSSWDSGSHHSHDTSSYDTSSYDTSSYDSGGGDYGGGDSGGGGDD